MDWIQSRVSGSRADFNGTNILDTPLDLPAIKCRMPLRATLTVRCGSHCHRSHLITTRFLMQIFLTFFLRVEQKSRDLWQRQLVLNTFADSAHVPKSAKNLIQHTRLVLMDLTMKPQGGIIRKWYGRELSRTAHNSSIRRWTDSNCIRSQRPGGLGNIVTTAMLSSGLCCYRIVAH